MTISGGNHAGCVRVCACACVHSHNRSHDYSIMTYAHSLRYKSDVETHGRYDIASRLCSSLLPNLDTILLILLAPLLRVGVQLLPLDDAYVVCIFNYFYSTISTPRQQ